MVSESLFVLLVDTDCIITSKVYAMGSMYMYRYRQLIFAYFTCFASAAVFSDLSR